MKTCSIQQCGKKHKGHGFCEMHLDRWKKGTDLYAPAQGDNRCILDNCERPKGHLGYCRAHARELRIGAYGEKCKLDFCDNYISVITPRLCFSHYTQLRKGQELKPVREITGQHVTNQGYICIYKADHPNSRSGQILEHIWVMSEHLGRPLIKGENVHHKNGNRSDNRLENLELWSTAQPAGQRVEDKVQYALEILALYGKDFQQP